MTAKTRTRSQRLIFSEFERSQLGQVLLEHSDVLVFKLDAAGRIVMASDHTLRALGFSAAELTGRDFFEACAPNEAGRLGQMIHGKSPLLPAHARLELVSKSGATRTYYATAARESDGSPNTSCR